MHDEIRFMLQLRHGNEGSTYHRTFDGSVPVAEVLAILEEAAKVAHVQLEPLEIAFDDVVGEFDADNFGDVEAE